MTDIIGGVLVVLGGGMLAGSNFIQLRGSWSAINRARDLLGNTDAAVSRELPADMSAELDRVP